ncbi:hypothetical protein LXL04_013770 [Taraxacum kok-saghyz]
MTRSSIRTLYVGGLDERVSEQDLRDNFYTHGEIESVKMVVQRACAFVTSPPEKGRRKRRRNSPTNYVGTQKGNYYSCSSIPRIRSYNKSIKINNHNIWKWCNIPQQRFSSTPEVVMFAANWGNCPRKRRILISIVYGSLLCVWKARNDKMFNKNRISSTKLADNIINMVFSWVKYRGKFGDCNWAVWCCNPFNIL